MTENELQSAFAPLYNNQVGVVKLTARLTLQPMEVRDDNCFVRKAYNAAITEPLDSEEDTKVGGF